MDIEYSEVTLVNVPNDPDKEKDIFVGDQKVGTVCRGWLRLGGEQWVVTSAIIGSNWGADTLKEIKRKVAHKLV